MSFVVRYLAARHSLAAMGAGATLLAFVPLRHPMAFAFGKIVAAGVPYALSPAMRLISLWAKLESKWSLLISKFFDRSARTQWINNYSDEFHQRMQNAIKGFFYTLAAYLCTYYLCFKFNFIPLQYWKSQFIAKMRNTPPILPDAVRSTFVSLPFNELRAAQDHTHGEAASNRTSASLFIDRLGASLGRNTYFVQRSLSDTRVSREGSREYYWAKDLTIKPEKMVIPTNPLVAMVDVDQYIDMPNFLVENVCPTIIYTFQPERVSRVESNYSYTFDEKNNVHYNVTGGGYYTHPVWNYSSDHFMASKTFMGIPYKTAAYLVDRRKTAPDHEVIMLTPIGHWNGLGAIAVRLWLYGRELLRLSPYVGDKFLRLKSSSLQGVMVSTGTTESLNSAYTTAAIDDTIAAVARTSTHPLTMPTVLSFVGGERGQGAALLEYHRSKQSHHADIVCPVEASTRRYQFHPPSYDPIAKPSMVAFMSPLVNDAFCADMTKSNEVKSIQGRIVDVKPKELKLTNFLSRAMLEFAELLIPEPHNMDPVGYDEVLDRQNRPSQRRILRETEAIRPDRRINMFVKKEPYSNIKDPRAISQINGVDKREYSMYMYAFEKVLKEHKWYAFGHPPKDIAARVAEICGLAKVNATNSDFSRFDGHGSNMMRELERILLMRAFRHKYHDEVAELHKGQYNLDARATEGTWYETFYSRASGSPETSIFNTIVNAFVAFLAFRMTKHDGTFIQAKQAFEMLGIYGGDDGLTPDVNPDVYVRAAKSIGQELTVEPIRKGFGGIKFLARIYSKDVWYGDDNSCCDIPRQLSKFHTTVKLPSKVTPTDKLLEKIRSMVLSDASTPVLGPLCQKVLALHGRPIAENELTLNMRSWLSRYDLENQYPNRQADWMMAYMDLVMPEFDHKRFESWLKSCTSIDQILLAPLCQVPTPAKSSVPVVIDDEVIPYDTYIPPLAENLNLKPQEEKKKEKKISMDKESKKITGISIVIPRSYAMAHAVEHVDSPHPSVESKAEVPEASHLLAPNDIDVLLRKVERDPAYVPVDQWYYPAPKKCQWKKKSAAAGGSQT